MNRFRGGGNRGRNGNRFGRGGSNGRNFHNSQRNNGPRLPSTLLEEIRTTGGTSGSGISSRKELRKAERNAKKANKAMHYQKQIGGNNNIQNTTNISSSSYQDKSTKGLSSSGMKSSRAASYDVNHNDDISSKHTNKKSKNSHHSYTKQSYDSSDSENNIEDDEDIDSDEADDYTNTKSKKRSRQESKSSKNKVAKRSTSDSEQSEDDDEDDGDSDMSDIEDDTNDDIDPKLAAAIQARGLAALNLDNNGAAEDDEKLIRELEKKLGIPERQKKNQKNNTKNSNTEISKTSKKAIKKLNKEYAEEGLDEDFGSYLAGLDSIIYDDDDYYSNDNDDNEDDGNSEEEEEDEDGNSEEEEEGDDDENDDDDEDIYDNNRITSSKKKNNKVSSDDEDDDDDEDEDDDDDDDNDDEVDEMDDNDSDDDDDDSDDDIPETDEYDFDNNDNSDNDDDDENDSDDSDDPTSHANLIKQIQKMKKAAKYRENILNDLETNNKYFTTISSSKAEAKLLSAIPAKSTDNTKHIRWNKKLTEYEGDNTKQPKSILRKGTSTEEENEVESKEVKKNKHSIDMDTTTTLSSTTASTTTTTSGGKYIPPHLRKQQSSSSSQSEESTTSKTPLTSSTKTSSSSSEANEAHAHHQARLRAFEKGQVDIDNDASTPIVTRRIQSLLNKVSEANIEPISTEIASLYREYATGLVNTILMRCILTACEHETQTLASLVLSLAALIASLHIRIGPTVGSMALERTLLRFIDTAGLPLESNPIPSHLQIVREVSTPGIGDYHFPAKTRNNVFLLLAYLYVFHVSTPHLFEHCLQLLTMRFKEHDIELILLVLTHVGFHLRTDDPQNLRDVLKLLHSKFKSNGISLQASSTDSSNTDSLPTLDDEHISLSTRMKYLGEMIIDLKNNRRRQNSDAILDRGSRLRKWLNHIANKTNGLQGIDRRLRIGWPDILNIPEKGRWWLVGSSWVGRQAAGLSSQASTAVRLSDGKVVNKDTKSNTTTSTSSTNEEGLFSDWNGITSGNNKSNILNNNDTFIDEETNQELLSSSSDTNNSQLLELAQRMRMNTPVRRSIFIALMGAEDVDAAVDRLLQLGLKGSAEREIVRVILDCAAQEIAYNPFYATVSTRICTIHSRFRFTYQLAYWDIFKTFSDPELSTTRRIYNLAQLFSYLLIHNVLTLASLKTLDLTASNEDTIVLFGKTLFTSIILEVNNLHTIVDIFRRIGTGPDRMTTRDSILIFITQHIKLNNLVTAAQARNSTNTKNNKKKSSDDIDTNALKEKLKTIKRTLEALTDTAQDVSEL